MRWLKRDRWKAGIAIVSVLFLLVLMVWVSVSAARAYERSSGLATPVTGTVQATPTMQATPTIDPTIVAATAKEQLIKLQRDNERNFNAWFWNASATLGTIVAALLAVAGVLATVVVNVQQWKDTQDKDRIARQDAQDKDRIARQDAQDKDLKDKAEERFKTAVAALGDEKEGTQVGGAVLLRSFLSKDDEKIYGRYYTQIFDLAAAYLRLPSTSYPSEDPDGIPHSSGLLHSLAPLRQTLLVVFKEVFPLARERLRKKDPKTQFHPHLLDATDIKLDGAFLAYADLVQAWLHGASLHEAYLRETHLCKAHLEGANLAEADLEKAILEKAILYGAHLEGAHLYGAQLKRAYLNDAHLSGADLRRADLRRTDLGRTDLRGADMSGAQLEGANPEEAGSLKDTKMNGVTGLTSEQREACIKKGATLASEEQWNENAR